MSCFPLLPFIFCFYILGLKRASLSLLKTDEAFSVVVGVLKFGFRRVSSEAGRVVEYAIVSNMGTLFLFGFFTYCTVEYSTVQQ